MSKKAFLVILVVLFLSAGLSGCTVGNWIAETGTVVYNDFEGGFYGIITGRLSLLPINLPEEFKEDGLKVKYFGRMLPRMYTFYQWGIPIYLLKIEKLES
jgi:predicted small secreted protein